MDTSTSSVVIPQQPLEELPWGPLVLTEAKIDELWEKIQKFPQVFDDFSKGKKEVFVEQLFNPRNIFVDIADGLGLAAGFGVRPRLDMIVHLVMFDRRLRGREVLFLEILKHFFTRLQLRRVTSMITEDSPMTIRLVQRMGFHPEGVMRQAVLRGGKYLDMHIYSLLSEEIHEHQDVAPGRDGKVEGDGVSVPAGDQS